MRTLTRDVVVILVVAFGFAALRALADGNAKVLAPTALILIALPLGVAIVLTAKKAWRR